MISHNPRIPQNNFVKTVLGFFLCLIATSIAAQEKVSKAESYFQKAYDEIDKGDYKKSIPHFEKAIKADPTGACGSSVKGKAHAELGYAYFHSGDTVNAMLYYNKAQRLNPQNPFPRINKAALFLMQKKNQHAIKELDALIVVLPNYIDGYVQRGFIHHSENQYAKAKQDLEKALELNDTQKVLPPPMIDVVRKKLEEMD